MAQINNRSNIHYNWKTDTSKKIIPLEEIKAVVPRKHFPSIDYPKFMGKKKGLNTFYKYEPVIALSINDQSKAYPLNMLSSHEISNDSLGGIPILPTFCPLCNAGIVYDRRLKHNNKNYLLEFEVSGMLRNSDMIMADLQTESWWQQLTGEALVGELAGAELEIIPSMIISVEEFFMSYPKGKILSSNNNTKASNSYGFNSYENYDNRSNLPWFIDKDKIDSRLPAMERVLDLKINNKYKIYPFTSVSKEEVINDTFEEVNIVIFYTNETISVLDKKDIRVSKSIGSAVMFNAELDGEQLVFSKKGETFTDDKTKSLWDISGRCIKGKLKSKQLQLISHSNHFAFAWLSFYPDSEIYGQ